MFLAVVMAVLGLRLLMFLVVVGGLTVIAANLPRHTLPEGVETALVVVWIVLVAVAVGWVVWRLYRAWTMPRRALHIAGDSAVKVGDYLLQAASGGVQTASGWWQAVWDAASSMMRSR
jgi:hypothetical protein